MNKLNCMKTFILVAEEKTIVNAAKKIGITKAAASKQIIELESLLKVQLFYRTTRKVELTDAGKLYYDSAKKVFRNIEAAENIVLHLKSKPAGLLRITAHRYFGERYIITHLKEFSRKYPNIRIDLELADRFPDLEKENIDILCSTAHDAPENLVRKKIASVANVLCASPEYIKKVGKPRTPTDIKKHRYITHAFREFDNQIIFKNSKEISIDYYLRVNDTQAMLKCALQGIGFIKVHHYFVNHFIQSGQLIELLPEYREPKKSMYIFYQSQKFVPSKIRVFLDFIYQKII